MAKDYLLDLMRSNKTVFTFKDLVLIWESSDANFIKKKIYRYIKAGKMYSLRKGIYAKNKTYDRTRIKKSKRNI